MYYSVFSDNRVLESEKIEPAINSNPEFIIRRVYRGIYDQTFSERRVIDEHYWISFLNPDGSKYMFIKNGWKILEIDDPVRYNTHILVRIADPLDDIRIFDKFRTDCHYSIIFRNRICETDGLIRLYRYFHEIASQESWEKYELEKYASLPPADCRGLGNLHHYYYDVDTKTQPNINLAVI